jgi:exodeoxyribonuclease-3
MPGRWTRAATACHVSPCDRASEDHPIRITTWNVNSVRLRLGNLARLVDEVRPDVLCLQETKVRDELFPLAAVEALGFPHVAIHGQAGYHGVAVLARRPIERIERITWCGKRDARHLRVLVRGLDIHNLYVPAGGDVPDSAVNDKFLHKLTFLDELTRYFSRSRSPSTVLLGDLNVAPLPTDVWSHRQLLKIVSHTPVEVEKLTRLQDAGGFVDPVRMIVPPEEKLFTWWSYRARDWSASDRGRRLDHVWLHAELCPRLRHAAVLRAARGWSMPSDHVPVTVELQG